MRLPMLQGDMATGLRWAYFIPGADVSSSPRPRGASPPRGPAKPLLATGDGDSKKPTLAFFKPTPERLAGGCVLREAGESEEGR